MDYKLLGSIILDGILFIIFFLVSISLVFLSFYLFVTYTVTVMITIAILSTILWIMCEYDRRKY